MKTIQATPPPLRRDSRRAAESPRGASTRRRPPNAADRALQRHRLRTISRAPGAQLLHRLPDAVVTFDLDWRYVFMNRQAELNHKCRPGELLGRCVWEVFPDGRELETYRRYLRAIEQQQEDRFEEYLPMFGRWYEQRLFPTPQGLTVVARDITEWLEVRAERTQLLSALAALQATTELVPGDGGSAPVPAAGDGVAPNNPLRIFATMLPRPGMRDEMVRRLRDGDALLAAMRDSGALSVELQVADEPEGPLVVTILWESAARYARWLEHPQRQTALEEVASLAKEVRIERYEVVRQARLVFGESGEPPAPRDPSRPTTVRGA